MLSERAHTHGSTPPTNRASACASCSFERQPDEEVTDHLLTVFDPLDATGTDGQIHTERAPLSCACGFPGTSPEALGTHFLAKFTPAGKIAPDGLKHEPAV
jgi:hypothetical protein